MGYEAIDSILNEWAKKHRLAVFTKYRDEEVRSVLVTDKQGVGYQIFLESPPNENGNLTVGITNNRGKNESLPTSNLQLTETLEHGLSIIQNWIRESDKANTVS